MQKDPKTIIQYINAINEFEISTNFKNFKTFNENQAVNFIAYITNKKNAKTGRIVSKQLILHYTSHVRIFFTWLTNENGFKNIKKNDVAYIVLSKNETKRGGMSSEKEKYTVAEILSTIRIMPNKTQIQRRDKALISLAFLTTPRITALKDALIEDIKYDKNHNCYCFIQKHGTKNGKLIKSFFMANLQDIIDNVTNWQKELLELDFDKKDPLFPHINPSFDKNSNSVFVLTKEIIKEPQTLRNIFKKIFITNNLPYNNPHSFRKTLTRFIMDTKDTVALFAFDENIGHELNLDFLLSSYGRGSESENAEALNNIRFE